jgi:hypothetical protein
MIAKGLTPRNATPEEREEAAKKRKELILQGIAPVDATPAEMRQAFIQSRTIAFAIKYGVPDGIALPPEARRLAAERKALLIEQGLSPYFTSAAERQLIAANRKKRDDAIARGETPKNATPEELSRVAASREKLASEGVLLPGATPAERSAAMKARQEKINKGILPPNANAAERVAAGAKQVGNAFRRLFFGR